MLSWGPRVKASHHVNHVADESRMPGNSRPLDKAMESLGPGSSSAFHLASEGKGQHMPDISHSPPAQQVSRAGQPLHGSQLPVTPGLDLLHVHNRSGTGRHLLNRKFGSISGS